MNMIKKQLILFLALALLLTGCALPGGTETSPSESAPAPGSENTLTVHYIDVGQADCALLECDGEFMLIDGGNVADSSLVVSYLQQTGVEELSAVVASHAHEDHVGGLAGVLAVFPTEAVYSPTRTYSSKCFDDFVYYAGQQDLTIQIPEPGDSFRLGGASVTVLGPTKSYADPNNTSIVMMVRYGESSFLFTGDMESDAERDLVESGADLKADVLKVGHHGSNTSTSYLFLREVAPAYAVISVGEDNSYGHPHEEPLSRLEDAEVEIYRTDKLGSVIAVSDGTDIFFSWENPNAMPEVVHPQAAYYIGNTKSMVLHTPGCSSLPSEKNQAIYFVYELAILAGYRPCSQCMQ